MKLRVMGTGRSIPKKVITNDYIATIVDTSNEFIVDKTGIEERHVVTEETGISLATEAARNAIKDAGILAGDIDLIIVTTMTPDNSCPNTACSVQSALEAVNSIAIDINTACSGFIFAMSIADAYIKAGKFKTILIVSTEVLSKILDWTDRRICILFGDGAGAAVFKADETGVINICEYADGNGGKYLSAGSVPINNLMIDTVTKFAFPVMDGKEIVAFATTKVPFSIKEVLKKSDVDISEIKYFVLHQANKRIIEAIANELEVDEKKFPTNMEKYGNVSSASIPILLDEMNKSGLINRGDKIVLAGFGGGLNWAAALIEW